MGETQEIVRRSQPAGGKKQNAAGEKTKDKKPPKPRPNTPSHHNTQLKDVTAIYKIMGYPL
jgi:hypothetical protein